MEVEMTIKMSRKIQGTPAMIHANFTGTIGLSPLCHQIVAKVCNAIIFKLAKSAYGASQSHEGDNLGRFTMVDMATTV